MCVCVCVCVCVPGIGPNIGRVVLRQHIFNVGMLLQVRGLLLPLRTTLKEGFALAVTVYRRSFKDKFVTIRAMGGLER